MQRSLMPIVALALSWSALSWSALPSVAAASELKALFPGSLEHADAALIPQFERSSGIKVDVGYTTALGVARKVRNGEAADVVVSTKDAINQLMKDGKVVAGSPVAIVRVGVGVLVRKGAPKPDLGTVERFRAALLAARSIAYTDPALGGPVGIYVGQLMDQLGIGPQMKPRTKLSGPGAAVSTAVVNGEADIGFIMVNEIVVDPRVDFAGPLPAPIQKYTTFTAGIIAASREQDADRALIAFLSSPASRATLQKVGFEAP